MAVLDLPDGFHNECKSFVFNRVFSGPFSSLPNADKREMKVIFDKYGVVGKDVGNILKDLVSQRRHMEALFLKSEDHDNLQECRFIKSNGRSYVSRYTPAFAAGLQIWHNNGRPSFAEEMKALYDQARRRIENWVKTGKGEPELCAVRGEVTIQISRARSESQITRYQEGKNKTAENLAGTISKAMDDVFGGKFPVRLFEAIRDGVTGAEIQFNVCGTEASPFHGFTILSGAGFLAGHLMENYAAANWKEFLRALRKYAFREDICNVGQGNSRDLGDFNKRKFIFYHEHFHAGGFEEVKQLEQKKKKEYKND